MPTNPACVPAIGALTGLVAWWKLDETAGAPLATFADASGNGHTGYQGDSSPFFGEATGGNHTLGVDPVACDGGYALRFNGDFDRVNVVDNAAFDVAGPFTILAWLRRNFPDDEDASGGIFSNGGIPGSGGGYSFFLSRDTGGPATFRLRCAVSDGSSYDVVLGDTEVTYPAGHFVAAAYTGTAIKVYLDGALDGTLATAITPTYGTDWPQIGVDPVEPNSSTFSTLDNVAFINGALSDADIAALYAACRCATGRQRAWASLLA